MNAEYVVRFPNHTDDAAWMAFLAHLATRIEPAFAGDPGAISPPPPAAPVNLADELRAMGLM